MNINCDHFYLILRETAYFNYTDTKFDPSVLVKELEAEKVAKSTLYSSSNLCQLFSLINDV